MQRKLGDTMSHISLPAIDGGQFDLKSVRGKRFMLSFFRLPPARFVICGFMS